MGRARGSQDAVRAVRRNTPERQTPRRWSDETLRTELLAFVGNREDWPTASEFAFANREDLRNAVKRHGGAAWWAAELGLALKPGQDRASYGEADALAEATEVVSDVGVLPGKRKLRELGYGRLATYIVATGGAAEFARRHGLPMSARLAERG